MRSHKLIDHTDAKPSHRGSILRALVVGLLIASAPIHPADSAEQAANETATAPRLLMLCDGHPVQIVIEQKLVSGWGGIHVGQMVKARVGGDVLDGTEVVIPESAPVELRLRHKRRGQMGHGRGQLLLEAVSTRNVAGLRVFLRGGLYVEGKKHLVIDYIPLGFSSISDLGFGLLFSYFAGSGGSAKVTKGMTFEAALDGDHGVVSDLGSAATSQ